MQARAPFLSALCIISMSFFLDRFGAAAQSSGADVAASAPNNRAAAVSERVKLKDYQIAELKRCKYTHVGLICRLSSALLAVLIGSDLCFFDFFD